MKKFVLIAALLIAGVIAGVIAGAAQAASEKYYIEGIVSCDKAVVTQPNIAYCRLISGGDPAGLLYAIDITQPKRPVVQMEGLMKVDPIAHMKILELSDMTVRMESSQCANLLVENGIITWAWGRPLVDCLKPRTVTPAQ